MLTAVAAQRLPAGATAYKYVLRNGTSFENIAPPSGFDYATASNALLAELNMRQRPKAAVAMKAWEAQVAPFAKSRISRLEKFCEMAGAVPELEASGAGKHAAGDVPLGSVGHSGSEAFSGYELRSPPYAEAVGHFVQPSDTDTTVRSLSTWIGLNGTGTGGRMLQAGAGNELYTGSSPFWEQYCGGGAAAGCNSAVVDYSNVVNPGDTVDINVVYNAGAHMSYYQVAVAGSLDINATDPMQSGSNSGNVVDFWTELAGGYNIPTSTNIVFSASRTYAAYNSGTSVPFGSQNYASIEMTTDGNFYNGGCANSHILMYPSDVTSGGFVNTNCTGT